MRLKVRSWFLVSLMFFSIGAGAEDLESIAIIGTGDLGNSLGPKLAELGYDIVYGSRDPSSDRVKELVRRTSESASAKSQREAAQAAEIVILAVPWPPMEQVAQNLGNMDGKIVVDVSFPFGQGDDGYPILLSKPSSAELIQDWNPGARVVKWSLPTAYYIDKPEELGYRPSNLVAADDKAAKETVARMAYELGQDPFDAGPLRMSGAVEAQGMLFMVPLYQRRTAHWESVTIRSSYWSCFWGDDWSAPVDDADELAEIPNDGQPLMACNEYPADQ